MIANRIAFAGGGRAGQPIPARPECETNTGFSRSRPARPRADRLELAGVNLQVLSGNGAGRIACQKERRVGDVLGLEKNAERGSPAIISFDQLVESDSLLIGAGLVVAAEQRGVGSAGAQRVHPDPVAAELLGKGFGDPPNRELAGPVRRSIGQRPVTR